jgi:sugar phosphate isomerase/epimerase
MKLLFSTQSLPYFPLEDSFLMAKELGFDGIDLVLNIRHALASEKKIRGLMERSGIPTVNVHQPMWQWPYTSRGALLRLCRFARSIGAASVTVHLSVFRFHRKEIFPFIKKLEEKYAITICGENGKYRTLETPPTFAWREDAITELAAKENLHLTLDVPGLIKSGGDPFSFFEKNRDRIGLVHLHGFRGKFHKPLGLTDIEVVPFYAHLIEANFAYPVVLEVFPLRDRISAGIPRRALLGEVRDILRKDVQILSDIRGRA